MGLFDLKKQTNVSPQALELAEYDKKLSALARKREEVIYNIGKLYVENNDVSSAEGTVYEALLKEIQNMAAEEVVLEKRKLAVQNLRKCEKCGNVLVLDSVFCNKCGEKLEPLFEETNQNANSYICQECGTAYEEGSTFCTNCGNKLK